MHSFPSTRPFSPDRGLGLVPDLGDVIPVPATVEPTGRREGAVPDDVTFGLLTLSSLSLHNYTLDMLTNIAQVKSTLVDSVTCK